MAKPSIDDLRSHVRGPVITAGDAEYDTARRVYNAMIDKKPQVIVRAADTGDVIAAVHYARDHALPISVRGGGHSVPGFGTNDAGLVVDLLTMNGVHVNAKAKTARAEGGATWGGFNHATYAYGLATTGGIIGTTGVGGLTLGGGIGHLCRGFGLSCDNLLSADVVTADGQVLVASPSEHEDLFWAIRGGGGNFGVVTSFKYQLHPVKDVVAGLFFFPVAQAKAVLEFYRSYIDTAPEALGMFPAFQIAPPLPFIKPADHGKPFIVLVCCWAGKPEEAEKTFAAVRKVGPIAAEMVSPMPNFVLNSMFDALVPPGLQHYWKADFSTDLTDGAIAAHLEYGPKVPVVNSTMHIYPINGAVHRVKSDATAFAYRDAKFATVIAGMWPDPKDNEKNIKWVKDYYAAVHTHGLPGGYVNFMAGDDQDRIRDNYKGNYDRLVSIKRKYDSGNLFRVNQNIKP